LPAAAVRPLERAHTLKKYGKIKQVDSFDSLLPLVNCFVFPYFFSVPKGQGLQAI